MYVRSHATSLSSRSRAIREREYELKKLDIAYQLELKKLEVEKKFQDSMSKASSRRSQVSEKKYY